MTNFKCEIVWTHINLPDCNKLFVGAYYRPHIYDQPSIDELKFISANLKVKRVTPLFGWLAISLPLALTGKQLTLRSDHVYASVHSSLLATICDYGLPQLVTEPTRLDNTLDIYFTDHPSQITDINILPGLSNHNIIMVTADIKNS